MGGKGGTPRGGVSGVCNSGPSGTNGRTYYEAPDYGLYSSALVVMKVGMIRVNFPGDMAAGDILTGAVVVEPEGRGAPREENLRKLRQFVVEVDGRSIPAGG